MGYTIAISNRKGGVGKTTLTILLACELTRLGYKVLVVDCDSQRNSTDFFQAEWENTATLADIMYCKEPAEGCIQHCDFGDVIAADPALNNADREIMDELVQDFKNGKIDDILIDGEVYRIKDSIEPIKDKYDFILFDTATSMDITLNNVITASDYLIIPIEGQYAIDGLMDYIDYIKDSMVSVSDLTILGIVFNMFQKNANLPSQVLDEAREIAAIKGTRVFDTPIRFSTACERAISDYRIPLHSVYRKSTTQADAEALTMEILKAIKKTPTGKSLTIKKYKKAKRG